MVPVIATGEQTRLFFPLLFPFTLSMILISDYFFALRLREARARLDQHLYHLPHLLIPASYQSSLVNETDSDNEMPN
jgi:hypothetical protein